MKGRAAVRAGGRRPAREPFVPACCCLLPHGCSGRRRARPPARLGPHFVRRRASKPARALRSLRRPPHQWGWVAVVWFGASPRSLARPCRRPPAPRPGPAGHAVASNRVGLGARVLSGSAALTAAVLCPPSPSARITSAPPGCWCLFRRVRIVGSVGGLGLVLKEISPQRIAPVLGMHPQ